MYLFIDNIKQLKRLIQKGERMLRKNCLLSYELFYYFFFLSYTQKSYNLFTKIYNPISTKNASKKPFHDQNNVVIIIIIIFRKNTF